jgi:RNA polymerase sigma-70 factor (ECF subfamily)
VDAEDLVQEVLIKLVREVPAYRRSEGQSFRGWLFRVTVNQCRDFRHRKATRTLPPDDGLSGVADDAPAAEVEEAEYRRLIVGRALEVIRRDSNDATWAAFRGLMVEGRSAADVAAGLGISVNAVWLVRHRVVRRLREEFDGLLE